MLAKTKSGRRIVLPSDEEDAQIDAGIAADPDAFEWSEERFKNAVPFSDLPENVKIALCRRGK